MIIICRDEDLKPGSAQVAIEHVRLSTLGSEAYSAALRAKVVLLVRKDRGQLRVLKDEFDNESLTADLLLGEFASYGETRIPMLLFCPRCGEQHIDAPNDARDWTNPPHRSHECQRCGHVWRQADVFTDGVAAIATAGQRDGSPVPELAPRIARALESVDGLDLSEDHVIANTNPDQLRDMLLGAGLRINALDDANRQQAQQLGEYAARPLFDHRFIPSGSNTAKCLACDKEHEQASRLAEYADRATAVIDGPFVYTPEPCAWPGPETLQCCADLCASCARGFIPKLVSIEGIPLGVAHSPDEPGACACGRGEHCGAEKIWLRVYNLNAVIHPGPPPSLARTYTSGDKAIMINPNYIAVAKFFVAEVLKSGHPDFASSKPVTDSIKVTLRPVPYKADDPTHENSKFWTASPNGEMTLWIQNPNLFDRFEVGHEIYLPMILAEGVTLADLSNALNDVPVRPALPATLTEE